MDRKETAADGGAAALEPSHMMRTQWLSISAVQTFLVVIFCWWYDVNRYQKTNNVNRGTSRRELSTIVISSSIISTFNIKDQWFQQYNYTCAIYALNAYNQLNPQSRKASSPPETQTTSSHQPSFSSGLWCYASYESPTCAHYFQSLPYIALLVFSRYHSEIVWWLDRDVCIPPCRMKMMNRSMSIVVRRIGDDCYCVGMY